MIVLPPFGWILSHLTTTQTKQNPRKVLEAKSQREKCGRFFFSFPDGEAGLDVYK
jgi:hypothetical protein